MGWSEASGTGSEAREAAAPTSSRAGEQLARRYQEVRRFTEKLCEPLAVEDYVLQSMPDASPTKWHLAHTSWFFETFVLSPAMPEYHPFHPRFGYLFNSYYNAVGERHSRPLRGMLSRPTVEEIYCYRAHVDRHLLKLLSAGDGSRLARLAPLVELGLNHEQQHQELILTDIKHALSCNPLRPAYHEGRDQGSGVRGEEGGERRESRDRPHPSSLVPHPWSLTYPEGVRWIGHDGQGFAFDNETPRHRVFLEPFQLAAAPVTNGEFLAFIEDHGYARPELWLSDGWNAVNTRGWNAPLYWEKGDGRWWMMTLSGMRQVDDAEPVCHVSYYEADAYARWAGARLPGEAEWEVASAEAPIEGNFAESGRLHPAPAGCATSPDAPRHLFGDVWEWTSSAYSPYPGFRPLEGALGEYNGKFMCSQMVLRGGSCATPQSHIRPTYRNFFPPDARWQFTGLRLARGG
jgi:ergothioneine biosynthesis protein EgtB